MTKNSYILNAVKDRLSKINEEKDILEDFLRGGESNVNFIIGNPPFGHKQDVIKFDKPVILASDAHWKHGFQEWLSSKGIKLKKGQYSKYYQRYKAEKKKNG